MNLSEIESDGQVKEEIIELSVPESREIQGDLLVGESCLGAEWRMHPLNVSQVQAMMQQHDLPEIVARILVARGIGLEETFYFLHPTVRHFIPDPFSLVDMNRASERLAMAVQRKESIWILGDYDVDGATSSSLLARFLRSVGHHDAHIYIPDRIQDGYGPSPKLMQHFHAKGASLVVTVDCGTLAFEAMEEAKKLGLDALIIDHHLGADRLPPAYAVVNPNRWDDRSGCGHLAAVGVVFLLAVATKAVLRRLGFFGEDEGPNLLRFLDLVALGTVCDVVPLRGINRAFVTQGLKVIAQRRTPGLVALSEVAGIREPIGVYHLGYIMGPRVNAGGRVGQSSLGARLLLTDQPEEALDLAHELQRWNIERQNIEARVQEEALIQAEKQWKEGHDFLMVVGEDWHPGVVGVVASRLKERFHRPVAVGTRDRHGLIKMSSRSVTGLDLGACVVRASQAGILVEGGGHAMAAGFTITDDQIHVFQAYMEEHYRLKKERLHRKIQRVDGMISFESVTPEFVQLIEQLGPFGSENAEPLFMLPDVQVIDVKPIGLHGLRLMLAPAGTIGSRMVLYAAIFHVRGHATETLLMDPKRRQSVDVLVKLRLQRGHRRQGVDCMIEDIHIN
jgi:single-stranded-DNA-specific exonuclease